VEQERHQRRTTARSQEIAGTVTREICHGQQVLVQVTYQQNPKGMTW
jgi:hypothetical protein